MSWLVISLTISSLLLFALPSSRHLFSDVYSDTLAWALLLVFIKTINRLRPRSVEADQLSGRGVHSRLAAAIGITTVTWSIADTTWILPLSTPLLFYLSCKPQCAITQHYFERICVARLSRRKWYLMTGYMLVAVASCWALVVPTHWPWTGRWLYTFSAISLASQTSIYLLLDNETLENKHSLLTLHFMEPAIHRLLPLLSLVCLTQAKTAPRLEQIVLAASIKCFYWSNLITLCRQGHSIAVSTTIVIGVAIVDLESKTELLHKIAVAIVALLAVLQTIIQFRQKRLALRKLMTFFVCFILAAVSAKIYLITRSRHGPVYLAPAFQPSEPHPVEILHRKGEEKLSSMLQRQSRTLPEAIKEYKRRYQRHPPPHFDTWFDMAQKHGMILVDEFDGLMQTLEPFWSLPPAQLKEQVNSVLEKDSKESILHCQIRSHQVKIDRGAREHYFRAWLSQCAEYLPDMDLAISRLDEGRVIVPQDVLRASLQSSPGSESWLGNRFTDFVELGHTDIWNVSIASCPRDSRSRQESFSNYILPTEGAIAFIDNTTFASDVCQWPEYSKLHGAVASSSTAMLTDALIPIFSAGKISTYQDILYPTPDYIWFTTGQYEADPELDMPWEDKEATLYWRGSLSTGFSQLSNWGQLQRQRNVNLLNDVSWPSGGPSTITLLAQKFQPKSLSWKWTVINSTMAELKKLSRVRVSTVTHCDWLACLVQSKWFGSTPNDPPSAAFSSRLVLDLDGHGVSGQYYRLLQSNSAVLKQTLFREWHDDWLIPWVHYVPVSVGGQELPELQRWLLTSREGDDVAQRIATASKSWAYKVLREVDLKLVFFRLMLEYARLIDADRDNLSL